MKKEILEEYEKVKDKISKEEFLKRFEEIKEEYDVGFMDDIDIARMIVGEYLNQKNEPLSEEKDYKIAEIAEMEGADRNLKIIGRVFRISNTRSFVNRAGKEGKVANVLLADDTRKIRAVFWTPNIKLLKKFKEGDIIQIKGFQVRGGFAGRKEIHLQPRATVKVLNPEDHPHIPEYKEEIIPIAEIKEEDQEVNIIARITRISRIRTFERNGKEGKVASLELKDETGKITYTLWNRDTELIKDLPLKEGDAIKILGAQTRKREGEIYLTHHGLTRIIKGDFKVPQVEEKILKIGDLHEKRDVTVIGLVTKVHDKINFERADGTTGSLRSLEIMDDTGTTRVTLWHDDADLDIKKGDIIKIEGGNVEFDNYTSSHRINTNWNTRIIINPEEDTSLLKVLREYKEHLKPMKISSILEMEDEGEEVDVVGRILSLEDPREFQREDSVGILRNMELADDTGVIRVTLWDEKATKSLNVGDAIKIENARVRLGLYDIELSVGKTSRIMKPLPEDIEELPSIQELEDFIYTKKKIDEIEEDDRKIKVIGRVIDLYEPREFQRDDVVGILRIMELADDTGVIRVTLWDEKADIPLNIGDAVKIENPRVRYRNENLELSIGRNSQIEVIKEEEIEDLPGFEEIEDMVYPSKSIGDLDEESKNVKISGELTDLYGDRIISYRCPRCNTRLEVSEENICNFCGESIDEPRYLLIIPGRISDDTGEIGITFFGREAEKLLGMKTKEVVDIINKTGDEGALHDKVEDLNGAHITVIGNTNFDEYNEELRFNPKKIVNIQF
ncbi:MAG TPA: OB-fold nucleic acid binding domain-containing protein [Methanothermobacter sp.]|nr:OB-fold nucleic acid binding domain-containing protein [Methanothermobacter sp.]